MAGEPGSKSVADARQEVIDARRAVEEELDDFGLAVRGALDIPARVRRNPVRTVGIGAGAAFLLLGGPRRVLKQVEQRVFPKRRVRRLVPEEVDRAVDRLGEEDREATRAHLERDFASYLEKNHPKEQPNARRSFWGTYDTVVAVVGAAAARELVKRFVAVPKEVRQEEAVEEAVMPTKDPKAAKATVKRVRAEAKEALKEAAKEGAKEAAKDVRRGPRQ
jgi:ElaB/YqjD/DUF883 family membrane-anchored ribosome-binding protein